LVYDYAAQNQARVFSPEHYPQLPISIEVPLTPVYLPTKRKGKYTKVFWVDPNCPLNVTTKADGKPLNLLWLKHQLTPQTIERESLQQVAHSN